MKKIIVALFALIGIGKNRFTTAIAVLLLAILQAIIIVTVITYIFGDGNFASLSKNILINLALWSLPMLVILKFLSNAFIFLFEHGFSGFFYGKKTNNKEIEQCNKNRIDAKNIEAFSRIVGHSRNDFLKIYPSVMQEELAIKELAARVQKSNMTAVQKERATTLSTLSDQTIDTLRELHQLGNVSTENKSLAAMKLGEVKEGLIGMVDDHTSLVASGFSNIRIPDTFQKQERLEQLRIEGKQLLNKIDSNPTFDSDENKFRLKVIVEKRLDEVWDQYVAAKSSYFDDNKEGVFTINSSKTTTPDTIIDMIFSEIQEIYKDINNGVKSTQKANDLGDLLSSKSYFERR